MNDSLSLLKVDFGSFTRFPNVYKHSIIGMNKCMPLLFF